MKEPNLHPSQYANRVKVSDEQWEEARELLKNNTLSYVSEFLGVSQSCVAYHLVPGQREKSIKATTSWNKSNKEIHQEHTSDSNKRRYHRKNKLMPDEMKEARRESKETTGKEYFRKYMIEWRKRNPGYFEKYNRK